jgi:hypothetical protein
MDYKYLVFAHSIVKMHTALPSTIYLPLRARDALKHNFFKTARAREREKEKIRREEMDRKLAEAQRKMYERNTAPRIPPPSSLVLDRQERASDAPQSPLAFHVQPQTARSAAIATTAAAVVPIPELFDQARRDVHVPEPARGAEIETYWQRSYKGAKTERTSKEFDSFTRREASNASRDKREKSPEVVTAPPSERRRSRSGPITRNLRRRAEEKGR